MDSELDKDQKSQDRSFGEDSGFGSAEPRSLPDHPSTQDLPDADSTASNHDYFDEEGGKLFIPESDTHLTIPPGALACRQLIRITLMDPAAEGCPQSSETPRITPVVRCEPDGTVFRKPVVLSIKHCGRIKVASSGTVKPPKYQVEVYTRGHPGGKDSVWERDEKASSESTLHETSCKIWLTHFSDVDVFVKDGTCVIGKMLRAFPLLYQIDDPEDDLIIKLWMCNSDNDIYNRLLAQQTADGSKVLLDESYRDYKLDKSGKSVTVHYTIHSKQCKIVIFNTEIGYEQLWFGTRGAAIIRLKRNSSSTRDEKLKGTLKAQQEDNRESISFDFQKKVADFFLPHQARYCSVKELDAGQSPTCPPFLDSYIIMTELSNCLDIDNSLGNNWKLLAAELKYTLTEIDVFEKRSKYHTSAVLTDAWISKRLKGLDQLVAILKKIKRFDAVKLIEKYLIQLPEGNNNHGLQEMDGAIPGSSAVDSTKRSSSEGNKASSSEEGLPEYMDTTSEMESNGIMDNDNQSQDDFSHPVFSSTPTRQDSNLSQQSLTKSTSEQDLDDSGYRSIIDP
ncbi:netrin receptor UNC5A-like isoform X2 [Apostichopus japonicus]